LTAAWSANHVSDAAEFARGEAASALDLPRGILRHHAVQVAAGRRAVADVLATLLMSAAVERTCDDAELVGDDLRDLGVDCPISVPPWLTSTSRRCSVDQRASLVGGRVERMPASPA
jgi:hypothetical protein